MKFLYRKCVIGVVFSMVVSLTISALPAFSNTHDSSWKFRLSPYAWLAGQSGSVATLPGLPPADIDIDFWDDILGNINGALFLVGEARKDRWGIFTDIAYVNIESDNPLPIPEFSSLVSTTESWIVTAAGMYRLADRPSKSLDIIAGIRFWSVDSTLALRAGTLPGQEISNNENWVDPLVGIRGLTTLGTSRFFCNGAAAIGGFGAGSDFMWDLSINFGYRWGEIFSTTIGYRYLDVDYEDDGFLYDVAQHGPTLGLTWVF